MKIKVVSEKMIAKKLFMQKICVMMWQLIKNENLTRSQAMRKAWLHADLQKRGYNFSLDLFDHVNVKIVEKGYQLGSVKLLNDGYFLAHNRIQEKKILKHRKEAIDFAISYFKNKAVSQLPMF